MLETIAPCTVGGPVQGAGTAMLDGDCFPEFKRSLQELQARRVALKCLVSIDTARSLAAIAFAEGRQ